MDAGVGDREGGTDWAGEEIGAVGDIGVGGVERAGLVGPVGDVERAVVACGEAVGAFGAGGEVEAAGERVGAEGGGGEVGVERVDAFRDGAAGEGGAGGTDGDVDSAEGAAFGGSGDADPAAVDELVERVGVGADLLEGAGAPAGRGGFFDDDLP